jgi:hypothetical protein
MGFRALFIGFRLRSKHSHSHSTTSIMRKYLQPIITKHCLESLNINDNDWEITITWFYWTDSIIPSWSERRRWLNQHCIYTLLVVVVWLLLLVLSRWSFIRSSWQCWPVTVTVTVTVVTVTAHCYCYCYCYCYWQRYYCHSTVTTGSASLVKLLLLLLPLPSHRYCHRYQLPSLPLLATVMSGAPVTVNRNRRGP